MVEFLPSKQDVASSSLVVRSNFKSDVMEKLINKIAKFLKAYYDVSKVYEVTHFWAPWKNNKDKR